MPIRENAPQQVYRIIRYGNLMDLVLLDTRLEGRAQQLNDVTDPALQDPDRTLLGQTQKDWLIDQLQNSGATWKVIGQQVMFSEFHIGWASLIYPLLNYYQIESLFLDIWDGYPAERQLLLDTIAANNLENIVILTGDFHTTMAFDVTDEPVTTDLVEESPGQIVPQLPY